MGENSTESMQDFQKLANLSPDEQRSQNLNQGWESQPESTSNRAAISHGEPLRWEDDAPTSLGAALQRVAQFQPAKGIVYVDADGFERVQSYADLLQEAQQILAGLRKLGLKAQDKVIFQLERDRDFIPAFWGCVLGGFVPVPLSVAPTYEQPNSTTNKLHYAWQLLEQPIILTSETLAPAIRSWSAILNLENVRVETVDELRSHQPDCNWHISQPDELTLLLLTSGSTGMPKGVMLSHQNLLSMSAGTAQMNGFSSQDVPLNWMPLDHVGAIVFLHLMPVYLGCQQIHVNKEAILQNPLKWLDWIERYRATITWAPNFAFSLINERAQPIRQRRWDLSSMRFLVNAGESIVAKTARRFLELLVPHGLPSTAIHPAFGMSETSSGITWSSGFSLESVSDEDSFVDLGAPIPGASLRIVDDNDQIVEEGIIGRLQVKGLSVTSGYYHPKHNRDVFTEDGWFNTGDLGFLHQGKLTLTGRAKDVIIINGLNYYSYEIEAVVEEIEGIEISYTAACAVREPGSDTDRLAIFFHTPISEPKRLASLIKDIRSRVVRNFGVNPAYLIPVEKETIPKTEIGKIQRSQLKTRFEAGEFNDILQQLNIATNSDVVALPKTEIERQIAQIWQEVLGLEKVGIYDNFFELGGHSLLLMQAQSKLQDYVGQTLSVVDLFKYPTIHALANYLSQESTEKTAAQIGQERAKHRTQRQAVGNADVAVIGMSCRFPGADNIEQFWKNLREGVESISFFTDEELLASGVNPALLNNPNYVKASPILSDVESFDAEFFGYSAREAQLMDPQQRLLHECAWESLEDAGYNPLTYSGAIGLYAGASTNTYWLNNIFPNRHRLDANDDLRVATVDSMGGLQMMIANDKDYLTTKVSYKLNLTGPSVNVQTACSTSLVAIHMACQSLLNGECDMVLAGGVSVQVPQKIGHLYQEGMIVSPDGHCRAFDADARGTIFGSGVGLVVLKRFDEAIADGDRIYAVIKGSAINNDGATKVGYTAPKGDGQAAVATEAMAMAGVEAQTITYVETHGTGTVLGDPIEIEGLTQAFRSSSEKKNFCAVGSVKTNVGHLQIASGIVGFIKTALALYHKLLPPSLHFATPNPKIDFANSPFYVNSQLSEWKTDGIPRRAGVNSLGIGGTNAHVILEEAPETASVHSIAEIGNERERTTHLLTLSAKNEKALQELVQRYQDFLIAHPEVSLADVCFTGNTGRVHFNHRLCVMASDLVEVLEGLQGLFLTNHRGTEGAEGILRREKERERERGSVFSYYGSLEMGSGRAEVVLLFTGQGSQYVGMGRQLYETQPTFRQSLNRCDEILRPYLEKPLLEVLYPEPGETSLLDDTAYTQPALFALEYALFELWKSWGVEPAAVMGHSVGEYVAACVAGVFSLEDGLKLIAQRGRLMQSLPPDGEMVTVFAEYARVWDAIQPYAQQVAIAAINAPENVVISGECKVVGDAIASLSASGVQTKPLNVSRAFHSPLMEPILAEFEQVAREITYSSPKIKLISNLTGEVATDEIATPDYWCRHIRQPVRFAAGMKTLHRDGYKLFVECGPKPTLLGMGRHCLPESQAQWLPSLRPGYSDWQQILQSCAALYVSGVPIDWSGFDRDYTRRRLQLPTYPFQRSRYWFDQKKADGRGQKAGGIDLDADGTSHLATDKEFLVEAPTESISVADVQEGFQAPCEDYLLPSASSPLPFPRVQDLPIEEEPDASLRWETVVAASSYQAQQGPFDLELHSYRAKLESYDSLTTQYIILALRNLGIYHQAGERHSVDTLLSGFNILPSYGKLLAKWLERLVAQGILQQEKQVFVNRNPLPKVSVTSCLQEARERAQNAPQLINFIQRCGENLADVLLGKVHPLELLFPGGSFEFADYLYQQAPEARYFNNIARSILEAVVKTQSQDKLLRILEVGGGTGGTTTSLLPILPKERTSYWFTDVSDLFLEKAKQNFNAYPFVHYGLLDIEQNPQHQGYQLHSFDVVVAVNVLHATRNIEETLENVRSLLAPSGLLVMVEVTQPQSWFDITVGLIEGWQRFDDNRRGNNPLLSQAQWESVLSDCGFERVLVLPSSELPTGILGQNVLVAQSQLLAKDLTRILHHRANPPDQGGNLTPSPYQGEDWGGVKKLAARSELRDSSELTQTPPKQEPAIAEVEESVSGDRIVAVTSDNFQHGWESRLHEKVANILGISLSGVNLDTSLTNLGFDSLMAVELTNWIAKELGVNIPVISFPGGASITQLTNQVREAMNHDATTDAKGGKPSPCLIALQPQGSKPPFFCVHPIAGVAFPYYELTYFLGNDQPFYGLQSFGLAGEGKPLTRIEDMAAHYIEAMQAVQPQGPYLLGGWSFGAHVAFEMAQQLQQKGQKVALLAILDTPPLPGNKTKNLLLLSKILLTVSTRYIWPYVYDYFYLKTAANQSKKAPERGAWTFDKLSFLIRSSAGTQVMRQESKLMKLRQPILRYLLPVMWANNEALLNYVPKVYPGKITLFQTNQHLVVNQKDISWGWKYLSLKEVEICQIPGHHLNCLRMPHVKVVAEKLARCIERVESGDER